MVDAGTGLRAETFLTRIEYHSSRLKWLINSNRFSHRLGASSVLRTRVTVKTRPWHFKFQALSIEDLVVIEARRCGVETNSFTGRRLIIGSACTLIFPASSAFLDASDLILDSEDGFFVVNMLTLLTLRHNLGPFSCIRLKNPDTWVLC